MKFKNISIFWIALLFYPALYLLSSFNSFLGNSFFSSLVLLLITEASIFAGSGISYILYRTNIRLKWKITVLQIIAAITPFYLIHLFISEKYSALLFTEAVIFFLGGKLSILPFEKIVNGAYYVFSLVGYFTAGAILISFFNEIYHPLLIYIILMITSFIFMFLKNKVNIKALMKSRNYNEKYLSKYSKKYNNRFVLVLCLLFSIAFLLKNTVTFLYGRIWQVIKGILRFFIGLLPGETPIEEDEKPLEEGNVLTDNIKNNGNYIFRIILAAIIIIIFIIFIIKNRDSISAIVKYIYLNIRRKIRYLFSRKSEHIQNIGYEDFVEDVSEEKKNKKEKHVSQKKLWKRNLSRYNSMNKSNEKYRFGYGLILSWLDISGKNKKASETVNETAVRLNSSSFTKLTEAYNPIRYGNNECNDENISQLDSTLNNLHDTIN